MTRPSCFQILLWGKRYILQVTTDSSTETGIQLFYMIRGDKAYQERHAAMYPLKKGKNVIYFKVDQDVVDPWRLDPSYTLGEYTSILLKAS